MGKCLSCYKARNAPGGCMNESSNSLKNKSEKPNSAIIVEQEQIMPHATTGVNRNVNGSRKLSSRKNSEEIVPDNRDKPSPSVSKRHFPQFFGSKVANVEDKPTKRTLPLETKLNNLFDGSRKSSSRKNSEEIVSDNCDKPSPSVSKRHFPQFFGSKVASVEDKPTKRTLPLETKLNNLFDKYKDGEDENFILADGVERLCSDLNLQPDDFKVLILAWKFNADQMFQFSRQEFLNGCKVLDAENILQITSRLSECVAQLQNDSSQFKNLYKFTFKFGLDRASGQRILPIDMAICLWKLVFTQNKPPILDRWLTFLQSDKTHIRGVPRDTWNMFLNFTETIGNDLSSYNDAEAWPSIFDDFVEYENDRLNQNVVISSDMEGQNPLNEKLKTDSGVIPAI